MKKTICTLLLCLSVLLLAAGCESKDETQLIQSDSGRFQATAPASWQLATGQFNKAADIELMDKNKNCFFMLISSGKANTNDATLSDYVALEAENLAASYFPSNQNVSDEKIGEYDAKLYSFDTTMQSIVVRMNVYFFETDHYFAKAFVWGLGGDLKQRADEISVITSSIEELEAK